MATEIERKYLVAGEEWRALGRGSDFRQGYLSTVKERTVRVRVAGERGYLTIKGITLDATREEYEYEIPVGEAARMLEQLCEQPIIEKTRYEIDWAGLTWEVDEFRGVNAGLVVAEVELGDPNQEIELPPWVGDDVTDDPRYFNSNLIARPFSSW
ncbi:MAG: CYTH domain-containing protein [Acidimicrobiia bacterium]|nr:CYTH domain-containing protein [Acidimicrobiia bacterium]